MGQFGASYTGCVQSNQDSSMKWNQRRFDQPGYFILAQNHGQALPLLSIGGFFDVPGPFQRPGIEETKGGYTLGHSVVRQLADPEHVGDKFADLLGPTLVGWTMEEARKLLDGSQVRARGRFGVITTLEFVEHHFSKMGHKDLLVTRPYRHRNANAREPLHAKRLPTGLVQTALSDFIWRQGGVGFGGVEAVSPHIEDE